jgi:acetyl-CoA acetyltransferase
VGDVYIIGAYASAFGKRPDTGYKELAREAYEGVLADAAMSDGREIDSAWFGNCGMHAIGQGSIRGQVCFTPLVREGRFPPHIPIINVENACATSSTAIHGAWKDIKAGQTELSLALGLEKLFDPSLVRDVKGSFMAGIDQLNPEDWQAFFGDAAAALGEIFETGADRTIFMDIEALIAKHHMRKYGTTQRQIAAAAAKSHNFGALNPKAQYRFTMTVDDVLNDRVISYPLTRAMCAPLGDGCAAALLCSGEYLGSCSPTVRDRAVKIRASVLTGGTYRGFDEDGLADIAARKAYAAAGVTAADIDVAEVHDATSFAELYKIEALGFCAKGDGGPFVADGGAGLDGAVAVNTSGGLVSKGHPVGATGASMVYEIVTQLRGEAGSRQRTGARLGLAENAGGVIGFDEAVCAITILERC